MDVLSPTPSTLAPSIATAPPAERFPAYPQSWYLFCAVNELQNKPLTRAMLGRELVAFRTVSGRVAVLDARCAHQGAHLGLGKVVGETIQCPYHNWEFGTDGRCLRIPALSCIPPFARQMVYPVVERHGYVFVFNGRQALFPLPFFEGCDPEDFTAGKRLTYHAECSWYMLAANLFDGQHWNVQHNRQLLAAPVMDSPDPLARRVRFEVRVVGSSIFDRLLRPFAGERVRVNLTCWAGTFMLATGIFPRVQSRVIVCAVPLGPGQPMQVDMIVCKRKGSNPVVRALFDPVSLWVRRRFTRAFMGHEFDQLAGIRYSPNTLTEAEGDLIHYFNWAASLPKDQVMTECRDKCSESGNGVRAGQNPVSPLP